MNYDFDVFDVEWKDIQLIAAVNGLYGATNGGKARSRGVEGGVNYEPARGLYLSANVAYTAARLTQDTALIGIIRGIGSRSSCWARRDKLCRATRWLICARA